MDLDKLENRRSAVAEICDASRVEISRSQAQLVSSNRPHFMLQVLPLTIVYKECNDIIFAAGHVMYKMRKLGRFRKVSENMGLGEETGLSLG